MLRYRQALQARIRSAVSAGLSVAFFLSVHAASAGAENGPITLVDVTATTGIEFQHFDGSCGEYYIVEAMSAGLALFDFDRDGDVDIYLLNGANQCEAGASKPAFNRLYRNEGRFVFRDVTDESGLGDQAHGLGVAVGDYDNDGDLDVYLNNLGPNRLMQNNGDGTFTDVTRQAGVANGDRVGAGVCFLDLENDGDLDLYVGNYIKYSREAHVPRSKRGYRIYGRPSDYAAEPDTIYRNNGDGTFTDVSEFASILQYAAPSMGIVCSDYDRDGDSDIFVANDGVANYLFQNDGSGRFEEVGLIRGFAYDMAGKVHASMGVDASDYDNDGWPDFHVTSYQLELATLYRNLGGALLDDVTAAANAARGTRAPVTWGNGFADFDNDGHRDIFVACGHLYDKLELFDQTTTYLTPNVLLRNIGDGGFRNVSKAAGSGLQVRASSRGAGFDDLDNDGDVDAVILNSRADPRFFATIRIQTTIGYNYPW